MSSVPAAAVHRSRCNANRPPREVACRFRCRQQRVVVVAADQQVVSIVASQSVVRAADEYRLECRRSVRRIRPRRRYRKPGSAAGRDTVSATVAVSGTDNIHRHGAGRRAAPPSETVYVKVRPSGPATVPPGTVVVNEKAVGVQRVIADRPAPGAERCDAQAPGRPHRCHCRAACSAKRHSRAVRRQSTSFARPDCR